jgi:hypothetical protein
MTVLIAVGAIEQDQGLPIITMIVGYSVGNGMAALSTNKLSRSLKRRTSDNVPSPADHHANRPDRPTKRLCSQPQCYAQSKNPKAN